MRQHRRGGHTAESNVPTPFPPLFSLHVELRVEHRLETLPEDYEERWSAIWLRGASNWAVQVYEMAAIAWFPGTLNSQA